MALKRVDPADGFAYTYEEMRTFYNSIYTKQAIDLYWDSCSPARSPTPKSKTKAKKFTPVQEQSAEAKAKGKSAAKARAKPKARGTGKTKASNQRSAVVVDPYSSGKYLLIELRRRRVPIICVRSSTKLSQQFLRSHETNKKFWVRMFEFENYSSVSELADDLKKLPYDITAVFGGSEPGVELADRLAEALDMPASNSLDLLEARKDKAEMQECLRKNGVPAAEQFKSGDLEQLLGWANERGQWPLVAKPTGGAGSDGIFFCKCEEDLRIAHQGIIGNLNPTGVVNTEMALQEFLAGDEYIVDTVSFEGKHLCVAMWVYSKRRGMPWAPGAIISECNTLLPPTGEKQDILFSYVSRVLDAVGLRYGPCHTEVMFTDRGPILVEVNARLHGLQGPRLIELSTGISKATYAADALLFGGNLFRKLYQEGRPGRYMYPLEKQCVQVVLISPVEGYLKSSIKAAIEAMELPSAIEILVPVEPPGFISQSRDLPTAAGTVLMVHESTDQIQKDVQKIREAEENGTLYQVSIEPLPGSPPMTAMRKRTMSSVTSAGRSRLDSVEKVEDLWAVMDAQLKSEAA